MPIKVSQFVWEDNPSNKKKLPKQETIKGDNDYIFLTKDGTLKVERSQYSEDMMGAVKERDYINTKE